MPAPAVTIGAPPPDVSEPVAAADSWLATKLALPPAASVALAAADSAEPRAPTDTRGEGHEFGADAGLSGGTGRSRSSRAEAGGGGREFRGDGFLRAADTIGD